jgi:hypothetical protein
MNISVQLTSYWYIPLDSSEKNESGTTSIAVCLKFSYLLVKTDSNCFSLL